MLNSKKHKIIINKRRMDIISADSDFYEFMNDTRAYFSFDRLISENDRQKFTEFVESGYPDWFVVNILDEDNVAVPCYAKLEEMQGSENVEIVLLDIDQLRESEWLLEKNTRVNDVILGLYGDDGFTYYPEREEVEIIVGTGAHKSNLRMSLTQLQKRLELLTTDENSVKEFISGLRNGSRYLFIKVDGSVKKRNNEIGHCIIKCAGIYEKGEYTMSVGYIHEYVERTYSDTRKIEIDSLTGLLSKGEITNMVIQTVEVEKHRDVTLAIVDIDHFKKVNDKFGHMTGDSVIRQVASVLAEEVKDNGLVGRIGGDEFMILFYDAYDMEEARPRLRSIKNTVCGLFPPGVAGQPEVTLSIGCAAYPKDASNYEELFALADFALYRAKEKGRNRYIIYNRELHGNISEIKNTALAKTRINSRGDMSHADILCVIFDKVLNNEEYPLERLIDDYLENFEIPRIAIYDAEAGKVIHMAGQRVPSRKVLKETENYVLSEVWKKNYEKTEIIINDISAVESMDAAAYQLMKTQGIISCIQVPFCDRNNHRCILSFETVARRFVWNREKLHYYRLMANILSNYDLVTV